MGLPKVSMMIIGQLEEVKATLESAGRAKVDGEKKSRKSKRVNCSNAVGVSSERSFSAPSPSRKLEMLLFLWVIRVLV